MRKHGWAAAAGLVLFLAGATLPAAERGQQMTDRLPARLADHIAYE